MARAAQPTIILVRPQMGENIGAVARAMLNFGLKKLSLVAPRDGWPNDKAVAMAAHATGILEKAKLYETLDQATAKTQMLYATTARDRRVSKKVMDARTAMEHMAAQSAHGVRCALMFGPERTGLENEDLDLADVLVTIPTAPGYASLNIAQSVVVLGYEWWAASQSATKASGEPELLASKQQLSAFFDYLAQGLDQSAFWSSAERRERMWRNLRQSFIRQQPTAQDVRSWHGMMRHLIQGKKR